MKWNNPGKNAHGELEEAGKGVKSVLYFHSQGMEAGTVLEM